MASSVAIVMDAVNNLSDALSSVITIVGAKLSQRPAQAAHNYFKQEGRDIVYINVMNNLSVDCDCDCNPASPKMMDVGILASLDPVALDKACLDLVFNHQSVAGDDDSTLIQRIESLHGTHTVEYAEQVGLGSQQCTLVNLAEQTGIKSTESNLLQLAEVAGADLHEIKPAHTLH